MAPDFYEQDHPEEIDNAVPSRGYDTLPTIALGGSAGSLPPLQEFFRLLPEETGMAFVVVVHLSPEHASTLPELLSRCTSMRVRAVRDGEKAEPNCVYVIPPAKQLVALDGHFKLANLDSTRGTRVAVDLFFRSLADTHGPHAAAVVLSGADGDGALGLKRIKERGGLTIAQDPDEAEHSGMPRSAIGTGMVDWVLRVSEMPARILEYHASEARLRLPPEEGPQPARPAANSDAQETALRDVLAFLRTRTGRDFSYYKRATIVRRISRRMQINSVDDVGSYLSFLRMHPGEAGALLQDLLISVTNFFRDRDSFEVLAGIIPELFKGKGTGDQLRVWVPACATGEEAYSIAMLLLEHASALDAPPHLQVFACDLDESAIAQARAGAYPESIIADVSEERLRRFFIKEPHGYRVRRELREIVLFAAHDLLKDSPFSRMDLISCRNLFIYLTRDAQNRALDIFHFAMKPGGVLFLGSSESVEDESRLFAIVDKKHRIYRHRSTHRSGVPIVMGAGLLQHAVRMQEYSRGLPVLPSRSFSQTPAIVSIHGTDNPGLAPVAPGELHARFVEQLSPPSLLVNADHEIVHLSESAGRFLTPSGGEPTTNLLRMVNPGLRLELRAALLQAAQSGVPVEVPCVTMDQEGSGRAVRLRVSPAPRVAPGYLLVVFEPTEGKAAEAAPVPAQPSPGSHPGMHVLEREVEALRSRLRDTVEQNEASTEELKASNEELQAMNEELRSASEELETSREELQSINEELTTVNSEHKLKIEELGHSNSDLHNLMASTAIATIFLDRELRITRYTPSALGLFRIIASDLGRPLADLRHQLEYPELTADALRVLDHLAPVEREVRAEGRWFLARLLPYRTLEDHIAGVVLTFVDITEARRAAERLEASEARQAFLVRLSDALRPLSSPAEVQAAAARVLGTHLGLDRVLYAEVVESRETLIIAEHYVHGGSPTWDRSLPAESLGVVRQILQRGEVFVTADAHQDERLTAPRNALWREQPCRAFVVVPLVINGDWTWNVGACRSDPRVWTNDEIALLQETVERTWAAVERTRAETALRESEERYRTLFNGIDEGFCTIEMLFDQTGRPFDYRFLQVSPSFERQTGIKDAVGKTMRELAPDHEESWFEIYGKVAQSGESIRFHNWSKALGRWYDVYAFQVEDHGLMRVGVLFRDITERKRVEEQVRESEERLRTLADAVPQIIWANAADGTAIYFNRRWYEYTGRSLEESAGLGWQAIVHPEDAPGSRGEWQRALKAGEVFDCEYRLRGANGTYRWFIGRNVPIQDASGKVSGWFGTATDIQSLKEVDAVIRANEEQFRRAIEDAPIPVIMQAEDGQVLQISNTWTELTGYTREDIPTFEAWLTRAYGEGANAVRDHMHRLFRGDIRQLQVEIDVTTRANATRCWAFSASAPGRLRDGRRFIVGMALDITERKEVEETLRRTEERVRLIVENARDYAIFSLDLSRRITSWNPGAQQILGYTSDEAIGQSGDLIFTAEDRAAGAPVKEAETALREGRAIDERWHVRKNGQLFWASGVLMSMHDANGEAIGFVKIFQDQTEELRAKEALEQSLRATEIARAEAEAAGKAKDHFLAVLSHELRTPLTPVLMGLATLTRDKRLPASAHEALAMIHRNVMLEAHFIDELLDLTRISKGKLELVREKLDLHEVILRAEEVAEPDIQAKEQQLNCSLEASVSTVRGDFHRLQQVFWNLLKNASKFTPDGGAILIRTWNESTGAKNPAHVVVEVRDTGIGFEPKVAEQIFDAFTQASERITREYGGLGLGLAISKATIEAHRGSISATSGGPNQGAVFLIRLPLEE